MITRGQIVLALAIAITGFEQIARSIDAQPLDHVARPAAAIGLARKTPLRRKYADASTGGDMTLEIGFIAEQPKPVLDLPLDAQRSAAARLSTGGASGRRERDRSEAENQDGKMAHAIG
jgi:hypothetical protein